MGARGRRQEPGWRDAQTAGHDQYDQPLKDAEVEKGVLISRCMDHFGDRQDGERGAGTEARRGHARRQAAAPREPFQRVADAGPIDRAGAHAADGRGDVQHRERARNGVQDPGERNQDRATQHHDTGSESVDQISFDWNQPGLNQDEDRECDLDGGPAPVVLGVDGGDEQRPAVLHIGDGGHTDDPERQLNPGVSENRMRLRLQFGLPPLFTGFRQLRELLNICDISEAGQYQKFRYRDVGEGREP